MLQRNVSEKNPCLLGHNIIMIFKMVRRSLQFSQFFQKKFRSFSELYVCSAGFYFVLPMYTRWKRFMYRFLSVTSKKKSSISAKLPVYSLYISSPSYNRPVISILKLSLGIGRQLIWVIRG